MDNLSIDNLFSSKSHGRSKLDVYSLVNNKSTNNNDKIKSFNVNSLIETREKKRKTLLDNYLKYYSTCLENIKSINSLNRTDLMYTVAHVVPECPDYNSSDCIDYIERKLREHFLDTYKISNNCVFITWKYVESNKYNDSIQIS